MCNVHLSLLATAALPIPAINVDPFRQFNQRVGTVLGIPPGLIANEQAYLADLPLS
jgi:hypothetical protein